MIEKLPSYITVIFGITTLVAVVLFCRASRNYRLTLAVLLGWLGLQAILGLQGFYTVTNTVPPRFVLRVICKPQRQTLH